MAHDEPAGSRLFIVCGKSVEAETLQAAFRPFGNVQNIKVIRDKGVAYVKYDKASAAALATENLNGAVLNNGRGPKLKVLLAEAPNARGMNTVAKRISEQEVSSDPDNIPPRSRLFVVVPKQADAQQIQDEFAKYDDLEYCKTDLIGAKGVVFCKFAKSSSALMAMEDVAAKGMISGYKVKCMLAEPKTKRGRGDAASPDMFSPLSQAAKLEYGLSNGVPMDSLGMKLNGLSSHSMHDYAAISGLSGLAGGLGTFNGLPGMGQLTDVQSLNAQVHGMNLGFVGNLGNLQAASPVSPANSAPLSKQRLFVVVHKGVTEELLARLFRRFPGMEYCDLKKDRATGKSKGYAYINYSTPEAALAAIEQLNGIEFPQHSGHCIKVMYAEPLGMRSGASGSHSPAGPMSMPATSPSPVHTPLSRNMTSEVASVQESLANMSMPRVSSQDEMEARRMSPVTSTVARELMYNLP